MVNQQVLGGKWHEVSGKLKAKWGKLSDDDVRTFNGDVEQLVGRIQRRTGETRESIEEYLEQLTEEGAAAAAGLREKFQETVDRASDAAREGYESLRQGYAEAERVVQDRPGQSMALAFGLGFVSGLGLALLLLRREPESSLAKSRAAAEHFGRHVRDALSDILPESLAKRMGA